MIRPSELKYDKDKFKPGKTYTLFDDLGVGDKNLYIVSTPLQLLSAIEAQEHFKTKNNVLVILFFLIRDGKNIDQMFNLSEKFPYDKLITYQSKKFLPAISFLSYLKEISLFEYSNVFFGYATPIYRKMIANIRYDNLYLIDDGVGSLTTHEQINNTDSETQLPVSKVNLNYYSYKVLFFLFGKENDSLLRDMKYFTVFHLTSYGKEMVIKHNFSYVKKIFARDKKILASQVFVLGQPLSRAINMKKPEYIQYIGKILDRHKDKDVYYIPHRTEVMSEGLHELFDKKENAFVLYLDKPVELFFLESGVQPQEVISFITSALFSLRELFPSANYSYVEIDTAPYSHFHKNNIRLIYDKFDSHGITKIDLPKISIQYDITE